MDIKEVASKIAIFFGYEYQQLLSRDISHKISQARNFAFYILHFDYGYSSNQISKHMNRASRHIVRQNATTKYLIENFNDYKTTYTSLKQSLNVD